MIDASEKFFLLNRIFGGSPENQINVNIYISLATAAISGALIGLLVGFYQDQETPKIIYPVYVFLGLIAFWQIMSFVFGFQIKSKFSRRRAENKIASATENAALNSAETKELLPEANLQNFVNQGVTENTTKHLSEKINRRSS